MAQTIASKLTGYLQACPPFNWRTHNCAQFAAGWLRLVEGTAPAVPGADGLLDARRLLQRRGGTLREAVTRALRRQPVAAALAGPGHLVLVVGVHGPSHQALGICAGRTAAVLGPEGVQHLPMAAASAAWRVGAA